MWESQVDARSDIQNSKQKLLEQQAESLKQVLPYSQKRVSLKLASEKGASTWLTTLSIEEVDFNLQKGAFKDVMALRYMYSWKPNHTPQNCECGFALLVEHSLSYFMY